jgi:hypothetical protein
LALFEAQSTLTAFTPFCLRSDDSTVRVQGGQWSPEIEKVALVAATGFPLVGSSAKRLLAVNNRLAANSMRFIDFLTRKNTFSVFLIVFQS